MGFYIDMINVNYGDSFLLTLDNDNNCEYFILIDGGSESTAENLVSHLKDITNGKIDVIVATHIDNDHIGGLKSVIENLDVEFVLMNVPGNIKSWIENMDTFQRLGEEVIPLKKLKKNLSTAEELLQTISNENIPIVEAYTGKSWAVGEDFIINILSPSPELQQEAWSDELLKRTIETPAQLFEKGEAPPTSLRNNAGIILELVYKEKPYALFPADVGADRIRDSINDNSYVFLKVPHHGSKTGLDSDLISIIKPKRAYLSVGDNNHGHPATEVLDLIKEIGAKTYCTNRTKYCRKDCSYEGFGNLCHREDKNKREGWNTVNPELCANNR